MAENQNTSTPTAPAKNGAAPAKPERAKRIVCDELRDRSITVRTTTVTFRPGEVLTGNKAALAAAHGILTRSR